MSLERIEATPNLEARDLVVFANNPSANTSHLQNVEVVIKNGKIVFRPKATVLLCRRLVNCRIKKHRRIARPMVPQFTLSYKHLRINASYWLTS